MRDSLAFILISRGGHGSKWMQFLSIQSRSTFNIADIADKLSNKTWCNGTAWHSKLALTSLDIYFLVSE